MYVLVDAKLLTPSPCCHLNPWENLSSLHVLSDNETQAILFLKPSGKEMTHDTIDTLEPADVKKVSAFNHSAQSVNNLQIASAGGN
jgi:hypothetical protein